MNKDSRRLIEADLPIQALSKLRGARTASQDVDVRRAGTWWSRKPQHQCRAIWLATLLPDPADERVSDTLISEILEIMRKHGLLTVVALDDKEEVRRDFCRLCEHIANPKVVTTANGIALLKDISKVLELSNVVTLDPFAGGGSIPIEACRLGTESLAGEYNPLASLYLRYLLEWVDAEHGNTAESAGEILRSAVVKGRRSIVSLYPPHEDYGQPFGYIKFRRLRCEGPGCGCVVPATSKFELNTRDKIGIYFDSNLLTTSGEIGLVLGHAPSEGFPSPTMRGGALTCPICHYTTSRGAVMRQGHEGLLAPVLVGCVYRVDKRLEILPPTNEQLKADAHAADFLKDGGLESFIPNQEWPRTEMRRFSPPLYGLKRFSDCHSTRQLCFLSSLVKRFNGLDSDRMSTMEVGLTSILVASAAESNTAFCRWRNDRGGSTEGTFAGKSIGMIWDFFEEDPFHQQNDLCIKLDDLLRGLRIGQNILPRSGTVYRSPVQRLPLPDDIIDVFYTDPPYYDAIPYAHLSDWPFVWVRQLTASVDECEEDSLAPRSEEIAVDRPHSKSPSTHDEEYFRRELLTGLQSCHRMLKPTGVGIVVFAHLRTSAWESLLSGLISSGFQVTASWPVMTERGGRLQAQNTASLQSSVHLVVRPKKSGAEAIIGNWRDVLSELPGRINTWLPRLASEGIVGADAIFACLGPALEIFSRYSSVERASGDVVELREYLEQIWAEVAKQALGMIFEGADTTGLDEGARLTAMWLWTLRTDTDGGTRSEEKPERIAGYALEYDAARKIAQGLGCHLESLTHLIEINGENATLLSAASRARYLFGKDDLDIPDNKRKEKRSNQTDLFSALELPSDEEVRRDHSELERPAVGSTILDQLHQSMILFGAGRGQALKQFLVEDSVGNNPQLWSLAQSLSALYPPQSEEKRWVDGVLARKKGLGF